MGSNIAEGGGGPSEHPVIVGWHMLGVPRMKNCEGPGFIGAKKLGQEKCGPL